MPCEHLPLLPPIGDSLTALDDLHVAADHLGTEVRFALRCQCRAAAPRQLRTAHEIAFTLWDRTYNEAVFQASRLRRRGRVAQHTERLRRHRATFEQLTFAHRAALLEERAWVREVAEQARRYAEQAAAGRKRVCCWVCDDEFYVPNDDPGDARGRYNCDSANCINAY